MATLLAHFPWIRVQPSPKSPRKYKLYGTSRKGLQKKVVSTEMGLSLSLPPRPPPPAFFLTALNSETIVGAPAASLDHEVTLRMEASMVG